MNILFVAPNAPPKNSAEAMQVARFLAELDRHHHITLVMTPVERGWIREDDSLRVDLPNTRVMTLKLRFHRHTKRVIGSRYISLMHLPDADYWLRWKAGDVIRRLEAKPDVIYSRSFPLSAALLGRSLKARLGVPWVMHLSDPWADGPYRAFQGLSGKIDQQDEQACFAQADAVTVTTEGFREFYANKYPEYSGKISVIANVMPQPAEQREKGAPRLDPEDCVHVVHTGAFYGHRRPDAVLAALRLLASESPEKASRLKFWFVGNLSSEIEAELRACPGLTATITGPLGYAETRNLQEQADVLLSIEPADDHPLIKAVLLSKMVDYLAIRKPILAITPVGSTSEALCARGYGWSIDPRQPEKLAHCFSMLVDTPINQLPCNPALPEELTAQYNVAKLEFVFQELTRGDGRR